MPTPTYTRADLGCWVDCAYGTDHAVAKLHDMLRSCDGMTGAHLDMAEESPPDCENWEDSEFCNEYLDDMTEALYFYTEPGLVWLWDAGDLILTDDSEDI